MVKIAFRSLRMCVISTEASRHYFNTDNRRLYKSTMLISMLSTGYIANS